MRCDEVEIVCKWGGDQFLSLYVIALMYLFGQLFHERIEDGEEDDR